MARLGDFVNIKTGRLDANAANENGLYPFFTCSVEPLKINSYHHDCECVLVAGNGDLNVKYYDGKFDAYQRTYIIESNDKSVLLVPYLYCFLDKYVETLRKQSIGGVIKYIKLGNLTEAEIPLCGIEEQSEIVKILEKVNGLIADRQTQLSKLDEVVKSRFIEMFGDVPKAEHTTMPEVCSIITDGTHQPPKFVSSGIPFLFVSNIVTNKITYNAEKFISEETYKELMKRTPIEIGDILLSTVGSYGHPAVVETDRPFSFQRHIAYLKPKKDVINSIYLYGAILSADVQKQIDERVKGIAQKTLNLSEIRKLHFPLPSMEVQNEFATFVEQTDKLKFDNLSWLVKVRRFLYNYRCLGVCL